MKTSKVGVVDFTCPSCLVLRSSFEQVCLRVSRSSLQSSHSKDGTCQNKPKPFHFPKADILFIKDDTPPPPIICPTAVSQRSKHRDSFISPFAPIQFLPCHDKTSLAIAFFLQLWFRTTLMPDTENSLTLARSSAPHRHHS